MYLGFRVEVALPPSGRFPREGDTIDKLDPLKAQIFTAAPKRKPMPKEIESLILSRLVFPGNTSAKWTRSSVFMILVNIALSGTVVRCNSCKSSESSKIAILTVEWGEERRQEETSRPTIIVEQGELSRMVCSISPNSISPCQGSPRREQTFDKVQK